MKKRLLLYFLMLPLMAFAHSKHRHVNSLLNPDPSDLLPKAGEGVKIVPLDKMNLPAILKKKALSDLKQQQTQGFVESDSFYPNQLLSLLEGGKLVRIDETGVDPYDTSHLKKKLSQIRLSFPFNGISFIGSKDIIGFSVLGAWKGYGWTGVSVLFKYSDIGICQFNLINMSLEGGTGEEVMAEAVRFDVNNKPTTLFVEGSLKKPGFLYTIRWTDQWNYYDLECANEKLDPQLSRNIIKLANQIDTDLKNVIP